MLDVWLILQPTILLVLYVMTHYIDLSFHYLLSRLWKTSQREKCKSVNISERSVADKIKAKKLSGNKLFSRLTRL